MQRDEYISTHKRENEVERTMERTGPNKYCSIFIETNLVPSFLWFWINTADGSLFLLCAFVMPVTCVSPVRPSRCVHKMFAFVQWRHQTADPSQFPPHRRILHLIYSKSWNSYAELQWKLSLSREIDGYLCEKIRHAKNLIFDERPQKQRNKLMRFRFQVAFTLK